MTINRPGTEEAARAGMYLCERRGDYMGAALYALAYADFVGVRSPEGQQALTTQAHVYATLLLAGEVFPNTVTIEVES